MTAKTIIPAGRRMLKVQPSGSPRHLPVVFRETVEATVGCGWTGTTYKVASGAYKGTYILM